MNLGKVQRPSAKRPASASHAGHQHDPSHAGTDHGHASGHGGHRGHGWMMIICCIPMIVIAIVLVATGVASIGFLFVALACTAMMALMMGGGSSKDGGSGHRH